MRWTEQIGLTLVKRDLNTITLRTPTGALLRYTILQIFPFTSESKRMGIIVKVNSACHFYLMHMWLKDQVTDEIIFYEKGADVKMQEIVTYHDWLDEEVTSYIV